MIMNAQLHSFMPTALETGLNSVRSGYQYGWNLVDNKSECNTPDSFIIAILRKLHTMFSGFKYIRFKRLAIIGTGTR